MAEILNFPGPTPQSLFSVPKHLADWESLVRSRLLGDIEYNLTRPQKSFRYPDFSLLPVAERSTPEKVVSEILFRSTQSGSLIFSESQKCFQHFLSQLKKDQPVLGYMGSRKATHEISSGEWRKLDRDPDLWTDTDWEGLDALVLSNPHANDGFYFPKEFYLRLYQEVRARAPKLPIYSEENLNLAVFNLLEAGSLKSLLALDPQLYVEDSLYPVLTPAGPQVAWLFHQSFPQNHPADALSAPLWDMTARALSCFEEKSGPTFSEFTRRKLATAQSIKVLSLYLNQALTTSNLKIAHWPDAGLHILIDITPVLEKRGLTDAKEWCLELADNEKILVNPGSLFGQNQCIQICYGASSGYLDRLGPALRQALV